jgi:hypothetical protein
MKRLWHEQKYKDQMRRVQKRALRRRRLRKDRERWARQAEIGVPLEHLHSLRRLKHYGHHAPKEIWAPMVLSFVDNPKGVSTFIKELEDCYLSRTPVYIDLQGVQRLEYDAIAVLLSVLVRFQRNRIRFSGNLPLNQAARAGILMSNFFELLYSKEFRRDDSFKFDGNPTHWKRRGDSDLSARLIEEAAVTVWGEPRRCPMVQLICIELMGNTHDHADLQSKGKEHWYVTVTHDQVNHEVQFAFVDYGVGVFESLQRKPDGHPIGELFKRLYNRLSGARPAMLQKIFEGELRIPATSTGELHRGKGLPSIFNAFQKNGFSDFVLITNDAIYDSRTPTYQTLSPPFAGTLVYWTLKQTNESLPPYAN